jgi:hypothetical protein
MDIDLSKVFAAIKDSGAKGKDFLIKQKDAAVADFKTTFSKEGMLGEKKTDPVTGKESREGGWLDELEFSPMSTTEMWNDLDFSEKRQTIKAIQSPNYMGDLKQIIDEIKGRTY